MQFKNFLQVGIVSLVAAASFANAIAQPVNALLEAPALDNTEIVQIIKQNVPQKDLTYIVKNARAENNERTEAIYGKINNLIASKYGSSHLNSVKNDLNNTLKQLGPDASKVKVDYSYATPKEIISDVVKSNPDVKETDTSRADNALDTSKECSVQINLAVDNKGRLFESSELASLSQEQVSNMSNHEIMSVLKETVLHEVSHCILQGQMKNSDFSLKFSDSYAKQNPTIVKLLNAKINDIKDQLAAGKRTGIDTLDYLTFINFHENFADVNGAFARLGNDPNAATIKETKEHILNLSRFRENSDMLHSTHYAIQYALDKIDDVAKMTPEQRTDFAKEIASDSLMNNMRIVLRKGVGNSDVETFGTYMVNGLNFSENGSVKYEVSANKQSDYGKIQEEIQAMRDAEPTMGTMSQKLMSYKVLMEKYSNDIPKVTEDKTPNNMPEPQKIYAFNFNAYMNIRDRALAQESYLDSKKKSKI